MAKPGCRTGAKELYDAYRAIGLAFKSPGARAVTPALTTSSAS
jgi:hypothetical protein